VEPFSSAEPTSLGIAVPEEELDELERQERHAVRNELMTLEAAAALAFERLFSGEPLSRNTPEARNRIAHALAALIPIYTFTQDRTAFYRLEYVDLRHGHFYEGGRELWYTNGKDPLERIAIRSSDLGGAIDRLRELPELMSQLMR
jgi:hypothetical protein